MKWLPASLLGAGVIALAGCAPGTSQTPVPITYPRTEQHKMQAAHHWDVLAAFEAEQILGGIRDRTKPIYIEAPAVEDSDFKRAYHYMLGEHLVRMGGLLVTKPLVGAVRVEYIVQVLNHKDRGYVAPAPGTYTALGGSAFLVGQAVQHWAHPEWVAMPLLFGADLFSGGWAKVEPTEVIITTRVQEGSLVLMSDTDVFYYNPGDTNHYVDNLASGNGRVFPVVDH
jgi:hypothetical protein